MRKKDYVKLDSIIDEIEKLLAPLTDEDKEYVGIELCKFSSYMAYKEPKDDESDYNFFGALGILERAKKELTEHIDRELLNVIGEELVACAKEHNKE